MRTEKYSKRAQEKYADCLFSRSNSPVAGLVTVVVLTPLGLLLVSILQGTPVMETAIKAWSHLDPEAGAAFLAIYLFAIYLVAYSEGRAKKIYTRLYPDDHITRRV